MCYLSIDPWDDSHCNKWSFFRAGQELSSRSTETVDSTTFPAADISTWKTSLLWSEMELT